jgi:ornithine cyclodeaminase/alanine dehydrogenase-like protein (mu-crystallin family)
MVEPAAEEPKRSEAEGLLVLSTADVEACLTMPDCVEAVGAALIAVSAGEVHNPLRTTVMPPFDGAPGLLGLMPAVRAGESWLYGLKEVCVFPGNHAKGIDSHQGSVLLHDGQTGRLLAIMNGATITAIRTAAATAVASRALARPDSRVLALVGAGIQARWHLESLALVHDLAEIRVCSHRPERAAAFAEHWAGRYPIRAVETAAAAVDGADIVTTVTNAVEPVVERESIADGTHLNAVGSSFATKRELDTATMAAARLFVDRRESTLAESGDYLLAAADGAIGPDHIVAEIGDVIDGRVAGRRTSAEITVFKSLGLAIEDIAAAEVALGRARELGLGTVVPF